MSFVPSLTNQQEAAGTTALKEIGKSLIVKFRQEGFWTDKYFEAAENSFFHKREKLAQQFLFDGSRNKSCFYISEQNFEFLLRSCVAVDAVPGRN